MERIRDEMEEAALGHVVHNGLPTGLPNLDKLMKGLRPGRMIVIGGFTSQGKTTLALNIAAHVALCHAQHIGIFSLEMKSKDLMENITSSLAKVNYDRVCSGQVTLEEATRIKDSMIKINQCLSLIHIDDTRGLSMKSIKGKSQVMSRSNGIKLLVIDYLQLVRSNRKFDVREQEVADTSREIKELSGELDIPVIVLSQLNEEGKLRESRAIGHDADTIWILEPTKNAKLGDEVIPVTLKINKNRKGPTGQIALVFQKWCCLFEEEPLDAGPDQPGLPYKD
jgi:replicative DNA helicase